jgi:hypothetical protein
MAALIVGALQGKSREAILAPMFTPVDGLWDRDPLAPKIHEIATGSFLSRNSPEIRGRTLTNEESFRPGQQGNQYTHRRKLHTVPRGGA